MIFTSSCFCKCYFYKRSFSLINNLGTPSSQLQINFGVLQIDTENSATRHMHRYWALGRILIYLSRNLFQEKQNNICRFLVCWVIFSSLSCKIIVLCMWINELNIIFKLLMEHQTFLSK